MDSRQDLIAKLGEYFVVESDMEFGEWIASADEIKYVEISKCLSTLLAEAEAAYRARLTLSEFTQGVMDDDLCQTMSDFCQDKLEASARSLGFVGDMYD